MLKYLFPCALGFSFLGFLLGQWYSLDRPDKQAETGSQLANYELRAGGWGYINPLLECEVSNGNYMIPLKRLKKQLTDRISLAKKNQQIKSASLPAIMN